MYVGGGGECTVVVTLNMIYLLRMRGERSENKWHIFHKIMLKRWYYRESDKSIGEVKMHLDTYIVRNTWPKSMPTLKVKYGNRPLNQHWFNVSYLSRKYWFSSDTNTVTTLLYVNFVFFSLNVSEAQYCRILKSLSAKL